MKNLFIKSVFWLLFYSFCTTAFAIERSNAEDAISLVVKAVDYIKKHGREKSIAEFNRMDSPFNTTSDMNKNGDLYVFVMDPDGVEVANGKTPKMTGKNLMDLRDSDGVYLQRELLKACDSKDGKGWVNYKWPNSITKEIELKASYVEKIGSLCVGAGIYKK